MRTISAPLEHKGYGSMSAPVVEPSHPVFMAKDGQLWLGDDPQGFELVALNTASLLAKGGKIVDCDQAPGPQPPSIRLCITVENNDSHEVFTALIPDVQRVLENGVINFRLFKRVLSSGTPISKISAIKDGVFASAKDGALYYGDAQGPSLKVHTLLGGAPTSLAASASGPMADIVAAKDGIATFVTNLLDALPKIVAAVEQRVGQELLDVFAADIKAAQKKLGDVFNKPLSSLIQKNPQASQAAANSALAAVSGSAGEPAEHAVRRLFVNKLELGRYLNPFSEQPVSADIPAVAPAAAAADGTDPMDALGKLFEPLNSMLDAKNTQSLLNMGVEDLLEAISGSKPISDVLNDFFNIFKIDETMNAFHSILSGGQCSTLVGQVPLKDYLSEPVDNAFFNALYDHYFPGKPFTVLDLAAFVGALFGYVAFAVQGKTDVFHSVFSDQQSLNELTSCPANLVKAISGSATPHAAMPQSATTDGAAAERFALAATPAAAPLAEDPPPAWRVAVACTFSGLMTLLLGAAGALSFGTGLIASPMTAGIAGGAFQCLGGIIQYGDTRDAKWDLLGGFAGGFAGAFLSTLVGNKLFGIWAQKGDTPSARIQKLKFIMIGFTLTLGGGGGAIVSSLLKNYVKSGKLVYDDPLALTTGAAGGFGGGAMGCGLHFMGALSGSSCLPVALSQADATAIAISAIAPPPPVLDNATALPLQNPAFPPPLPVAPNPPLPSMGIYRLAFAAGGVLPASGRSIAFVKWSEFTSMDGPAGATTYINQREKLFWLEDLGGGPPVAARRADLVIGVHGIGRYVFPVVTHADPGGGTAVDFSRPMYKDDFANLLAADAWITGFLTGIRNGGRTPIIKLAVCFSALPLGCCSLSQELATALNATVYGGRPAVYPWLDAASNPRVPGWGGWVKYDP
jgi:hypothetical protein